MKKILILFVLFVTSIAYSQDEALWLRYPAISPDGSSIVFSYKGDIYRVPAYGGQGIPLTMNEAHDFMPVWSPDGRKIAFASDRNGNYDVYLMPSTGGTADRLTYYSASDYPCCFTPDGNNILFYSTRPDLYTSLRFTASRLPELFSVSTTGGTEKMIIPVTTEDAFINKAGNKIYFHDNKAPEDKWRKHQTSDAARDIWEYNKDNNTYRKLTDYPGEDRTPVLSPDERYMYYLSERSGSFNVWKMDLSNPNSNVQITKYDKNPVRFLSISNSGTICFTYNGEIYTMDPSGSPAKIKVNIYSDDRFSPTQTEMQSGGATEMDVSPDSKEVAVVIRGDIFVSSVESGVTKRITNTPGMERSVTFSPDGKSILYASERNNIWGIYRTSIGRNKDEDNFFNSTLLKEEAVLVNDKDNFDPIFSPDGKKIAYLQERTEIKVMDIDGGDQFTISPADKNYSYTDNDLWFQWSPDSKWLIFDYMPNKQWQTQIGLADAEGKQPVIQLTATGYNNYNQKWAMKGKVMTYFSTMNGLRAQNNFGGQSDVYAMFFNREDYDVFNLNKEEYAIWKEKEAKRIEEEKKKEDGNIDKKSDMPDLKFDLNNIEYRKIRLTTYSSDIADALLSNDGEKLYYLSRDEAGYDLWVNKLRDKEVKMVAKLNAQNGSLVMDKSGNNIFMISDGNVMKIETNSGEVKGVHYSAEISLNRMAERKEMFDHMWREVVKKFYVTDLHGVDWNYYKQNYEKFLPYINNDRDFSEMGSELLGELNGSHTGCKYVGQMRNADATAALGLLYDESYTGPGMKIGEVLDNGPFYKSSSKVKAGTVIEKIEGNEINSTDNFYKYLNRKAGQYILISFYNADDDVRWDERVKPITLGAQNELLYQRWTSLEEKYVDKYSNGRLGYVHIRAMNDPSMRVLIDKALGKYIDKEGLVVDTRFNGGGNLHDQLVTFLSGRRYFTFFPRGREIGFVTSQRWTKPSDVIVNEGNYSDSHLFPVAYRENSEGKIIGMPVPGTGTSVWWENLQSPNLLFGIPEVGYKLNNGTLTENQQLEPDIKVFNDFNLVSVGKDQQLEKAVDVLLGR